MATANFVLRSCFLLVSKVALWQILYYFTEECLAKAEFLMLRGKALNVLPSFDTSAQESLSKAVKLDPTLVEAWIQLGECYWKKGDVDAAKNCFLGALNHVCIILLLIVVTFIPYLLAYRNPCSSYACCHIMQYFVFSVRTKLHCGIFLWCWGSWGKIQQRKQSWQKRVWTKPGKLCT